MVDRVRALDERAEARELDGGLRVERDRDLEPRVGHVVAVRVVERLDRVADRVGVEEVDEEARQLLLEALPPLRPAAFFWAVLPPLPLPLLLRLRLLPELLPPFFDASDVLAIAAARDLLMPFLRKPSYCLSSLTLDP